MIGPRPKTNGVTLLLLLFLLAIRILKLHSYNYAYIINGLFKIRFHGNRIEACNENPQKGDTTILKLCFVQINVVVLLVIKQLATSTWIRSREKYIYG